jgi:hypothetical protein
MARSAPTTAIEFDGWAGSMRSVSADLVPYGYMAESDTSVTATASHNFLYLPRIRGWKLRGGQTIQFEASVGAATGLLPALWVGENKCRRMEEFESDSLASDDYPTLSALVTKETMASGTDDGKFANLYVRDQVSSAHYTLCSEYDTTTYPTPGTAQSFKVCPLWHGSGEGGVTRGIDEWQRRLIGSGSRSYQKVGNWWYLPARDGTPFRWSGGKASAAVSTLIGTGDDNGTFGANVWQFITDATCWDLQ